MAFAIFDTGVYWEPTSADSCRSDVAGSPDTAAFYIQVGNAWMPP
jgi:hypothetical protein